MSAPGLRRGVRLAYDPVRQTHALLYPEGTLLLDDVAADVLKAVDGRRTADGIGDVLAQTYDGVRAEDVTDLLDDLIRRRLVTLDGSGAPATVAGCAGAPMQGALPIGMLAELTYRCPLQCTYCSNPVELPRYRAELATDAWGDVLGQARRLGVLQVHFSGGEPLLRRDLVELVAIARRLGLYTNLVTSGIPLTTEKLRQLVDAGLEHLQLSIQDDRPAEADRMAGLPAHQRKVDVANLVTTTGLPLTVNVVLHAGNVGRIGGDRRPRGRARRRSPRAGAHPVLRLGVAQPGHAVAQRRTGRPSERAGGRRCTAATARRWRSCTSSRTTSPAGPSRA